MRVIFHGTRGSIAVPGQSTLRYGGNTACVEVRSAAGTLIVLDSGTGAFGLGQSLMDPSASPGIARRGHLLITHTHWDHIQGVPFFAPLFAPDWEWDLYAPRGLVGSLKETLSGQMQSSYFPIAIDQLGATIRYHELVEGAFDIEDVHVRTQYLNHTALTLGYRLEADGSVLVYACDHEPFSRQLSEGEGPIVGSDLRHASFLADADLVVHDAQYTPDEYFKRVGWGHSTPQYAAHLCLAAGARRLALTHHDPNRGDAGIDAIVEKLRSEVASRPDGGDIEIFGAAEGQALELVGEAPRRPRHADAFSAVASVGPALVGHSVVLGLSDAAECAELAEAIRADGVKVTAVADTDAVLQTCRAEPASLVLLDEHLGDMGAVQTCRTLRREGILDGDVPIIVTTYRHETAESRTAGVTEWLERPFSTIYARARIRSWLLRQACRWLRAPLSSEEDVRIAALRSLDLLDTPPEERFDQITRRAAALFDVPIALVSLVDENRQWIKSSYGLSEIRSTSREVSFCAHVVAQRAPMIVPDTLLDDRFAENPMVTGGPRIRFYAGFPLILPEGACVGSLCLIDNRPRQLDKAGARLLRDLGEKVGEELCARAATSPSRKRAKRSRDATG
jgi:phosphoribosyl 1,2-cyclic phosphodiesterase/CheY-like chemotaxis protein